MRTRVKLSETKEAYFSASSDPNPIHQHNKIVSIHPTANKRKQFKKKVRANEIAVPIFFWRREHFFLWYGIVQHNLSTSTNHHLTMLQVICLSQYKLSVPFREIPFDRALLQKKGKAGRRIQDMKLKWLESLDQWHSCVSGVKKIKNEKVTESTKMPLYSFAGRQTDSNPAINRDDNPSIPLLIFCRYLSQSPPHKPSSLQCTSSKSICTYSI